MPRHPRHHERALDPVVVTGVGMTTSVGANREATWQAVQRGTSGVCCLTGLPGIPDNLRTLPRARWQLPGFCLSMASTIRRAARNARLVHAHWIETGAIAGLADWRRTRPLVLTVHPVHPRLGRLGRYALRRANGGAESGAETRYAAMGRSHARFGRLGDCRDRRTERLFFQLDPSGREKRSRFERRGANKGEI